MKRIVPDATILLVSTALFALVGCNPSSTERPPATDKVETNAHGDSSADKSAMEKMKAELAKLPPEDAASAEKQHFCPVTGEMLGSMGPPKKVDVKGRQVWICCEGCRKELLANPEKYFAKLKDQ